MQWKHKHNFVLTRQALLLFGGSAAGYRADPASPGLNVRPPLIDKDFEYAPLIRDYETEWRRPAFGATVGRVFPGPIGHSLMPSVNNDASANGGLDPDTPGNPLQEWPNPKLIRHGRTDVVAQSLGSAIRWLEGQPDEPTFSSLTVAELDDATAFDRGWWDFPSPTYANDSSDRFEEAFFDNNDWTAFGTTVLDAPLWRRASDVTPGLTESEVYLYNVRGIQSALAGTLTRVLVDPEPPALRRTIDPTLPASRRPSVDDALMDVHALLAEHCVSFEVAWSDGSVWEGFPNRPNDAVAIDLFGNANPDLAFNPGDLLWFDMDFTVSDLWNIVGARDAEALYGSTRPRGLPLVEVGRSRVLTDGLAGSPLWSGGGAPALHPIRQTSVRRDIDFERPADGRSHSASLWTLLDTNQAPSGPVTSFNYGVDERDFGVAPYSPLWTGGAPAPGSAGPEEYLAVWGFRPPDTRGGYFDRAWPKPRFVRVRMTLVDGQSRLEGGKEYEFVLRLAPQDSTR